MGVLAGAEPCVWLIAGPTASGKSALAVRLAQAIGGEIVNADSMQLYRELPILTAGPGPAELTAAPHHLYGVADAVDGWSVGRWLRAVLPVLDAIKLRGRSSIVVGGTGLYFRALTHGLAEVPPVPAAARDAAEALFLEAGEAALRARLRSVDPQSERRIAPGDRQRLVRAVTVAQATGTALSAWQSATRPPLERFRAVVLAPDRAALYARADARFTAMLKAGALEEAHGLLSRGLDPALPLMKAVGLRELGRHLTGEISLDEAAALARQETRRYAKRQTTWFRIQTAGWPRIETLEPQAQWAALMDLPSALLHSG